MKKQAKPQQTEPQAPSRVDRMNAKTNILARRLMPGATFNNLGGELRKCLPPQGTPITEAELCRRIAKVLRRWTKNVEEQGKKTGAVTDLELVAVEYPLKRKNKTASIASS